jgi:hypothetical protein
VRSPECFGTIFHRHGPAIYRYIARRLHRRHQQAGQADQDRQYPMGHHLRTRSMSVRVLAGRWGNAIGVPGLAALNKGEAVVLPVSCAPAGTCAAGVDYSDRSDNDQGFVVSQTR